MFVAENCHRPLTLRPPERERDISDGVNGQIELQRHLGSGQHAQGRGFHRTMLCGSAAHDSAFAVTACSP